MKFELSMTDTDQLEYIDSRFEVLKSLPPEAVRHITTEAKQFGANHLEQFPDTEWSDRAWTLQEISLASELILLRGRKAFS